jgi:hypothetical protein
LHWVSKLQTEIAISTLEAEYITLSQSMRDLLSLRSLLSEVGTLQLEFATDAKMHSKVFQDNNGAMGMALSPRITPRTEYIGVKYHFFREHIGVERGITIHKIESAEQKSDIFAKGLPEAPFRKLRKYSQDGGAGEFFGFEGEREKD